MPKRKTGAKKKKQRQQQIQKEIRKRRERGDGEISADDLTKLAANKLMECSECGRRQRNRAVCYFCSTVQRLPQCGECGRIKCMGGDCLVPHPGKSATGMAFVGCICAFCETFICHARGCVQNHTCPECPLEDAACVECTRTVRNTGGRFFICATCQGWLCEDDQLEHQASCTYLDAEDFTCLSCNRFGTYCCLQCKIAFCDKHKDSKVTVEASAAAGGPVCKRCRTLLRITKDLPVSTRTHEFGRQQTTQSSAY